MNGGVPVSHRSAQAPQGIHNLGEALIAICTLTHSIRRKERQHMRCGKLKTRS
jgi:hypothetical protein